MVRIFFAFPDEMQKASPLFRSNFFISTKVGLPFTLISGKSKIKNPVDPV
jgi:hypothetical protein